ncbi:hypothetical protein V8G61_02080 [Gaetbulibacter sp. M240]|uniref:hypothetical protein n=1 Tax=Gaetbulibacter sp. M240 TaxID=3126511 RepID=UPI00374FD73A
MRNFFICSIMLLAGSSLFGQIQPANSPWFFEIGANVVDVYPVGEDLPQGPFFDEFLNAKDHWNLGVPSARFGYYFKEDLFVSLRGSFNSIKRWGELPGQYVAKVNDLNYIGVDAMINKDLKKIFKNENFEPYVAAGFGYTWIQEGQYNANGNGTGELVGAGTLNGGLGLKYWISDSFGFNIDITYKHSFEDYLTKHWQHNIGMIFRFRRGDCDCY